MFYCGISLFCRITEPTVILRHEKLPFLLTVSYVVVLFLNITAFSFYLFFSSHNFI